MTGAEIAVVLGASLLGAFVKSITGMGYPLIAVPIITLALGIEDAVVIVAFPNLILNATLCLDARDGRGQARDLPALVGAGFLGAFLGTFALVSVPEDPLLIVLALTIVGFVLNYLRDPALRIAPGDLPALGTRRRRSGRDHAGSGRGVRSGGGHLAARLPAAQARLRLLGDRHLRGVRCGAVRAPPRRRED